MEAALQKPHTPQSAPLSSEPVEESSALIALVSRSLFFPILLILLGAVVFSLILREPIASDDCSYFEYAAGKLPKYQHANGQRLGLIYAIQLAQSLFGWTDIAYYAVPFVYFLGTLLAVYSLCTIQFSPLVGFITALLVLSEPVMLINAPLLLPEVGAVFWFLVGLRLFLGAAKDEIPSRTSTLLAVLSCTSFFMAIWTKETLALPCLGVALYCLFAWRNQRLRTVLFTVIATALSLHLLEAAFYWFRFDDPFYRISTIMGGHVTGAQTLWVSRGLVPEENLLTRFFTALTHNPFFSTFLFAGLPYHVWYIALGLSAVVAAFFTSSRLLQMLACLVIVSSLLLSFAVVSVDPVVPLLRTKHRYFLIVTVFMAPLIVGTTALALRRIQQLAPTLLTRASISVLAAIGLFFPLYATAVWVEGFPFTVRNGANLNHELRRTVAELRSQGHEVKRIIGPYRSLRAVQFFLPEEEVLSERYLKGSPRLGDLVLSNQSAFRPEGFDYFWSRVGSGKAKRSMALFYYAKDLGQTKQVLVKGAKPPLQENIGKYFHGTDLTVFEVRGRQIRKVIQEGRILLETTVGVPVDRYKGAELSVEFLDGSIDVTPLRPSAVENEFTFTVVTPRYDFSKVKKMKIQFSFGYRGFYQLRGRRIVALLDAFSTPPSSSPSQQGTSQKTG